MAWLKQVLVIFQFLKELWDRFKPVKSDEQSKDQRENLDESTEAKEDPNARPKW